MFFLKCNFRDWKTIFYNILKINNKANLGITLSSLII